MGHIVEGLDSTDITEIPRNVVEENIHIFAEADLEAEKAVAIMEKMESARRKRRAVGKAEVYKISNPSDRIGTKLNPRMGFWYQFSVPV